MDICAWVEPGVWTMSVLYMAGLVYSLTRETEVYETTSEAGTPILEVPTVEAPVYERV